jgi:neutral amino acid transport system permease protein
VGNDPPRPVSVSPTTPGAVRPPTVRAIALLPVLGLVALLLGLLVAPGASAAPPGAAPPGASPAGAAPPVAQTEPPSGIRGTLRDGEGNPVEGATIIVEQDGEEVAEGESDETGSFVVEVPEAGDYVVRIDPDSLPEGVTVREGFEEREVSVREGNLAPALFPLGEGNRQITSKFDQFLQLLVGGFQFGLVIAMAAIGLSLIFGTTGLTNFAHAELVTGGAILAWVFNTRFDLNLIPATLLAVAVGGIIGGLLDRGLWRPLRKRGTGLIAALVVSIGLAIAMRFTYLYFFGGSSRSYAQYATQQPLSFGPISILTRDIIIIVVSIVVLVAVGVALQRTRLGKATRAVADNPSLAASSGIDVERVINVVWVAGTGLAVLGGVFLALSQQVGWLLGFNILLLLFAGVTLGGLGTAFGALVGSLVIGIFTQVSTLVIPAELQNVGALVVLILILVVRPQGILGRAERVG